MIDYLKEENRILREQRGRRRLRFTDAQRRRLAELGKALGRRALGRRALGALNPIITPDTILRWYRQLIADKYDGSRHRGPGRPRTDSDIQALILKLANENPSWGYTRIRDALFHLGHDIARSTVAAILGEHGIDPAPKRRNATSWTAFLRAHWGAIAAADFFTVEVLTLRGLVRFYVFFIIELHTRRVHIAGIARQPYGDWMIQIARNLLDADDGFLHRHRYLILDRDPLYTADFRELLRLGGVETIRLPARSPNLNAFAERFVLSIKSECLDKPVVCGERHLRAAVREYVAHYHAERPHQGLGGAIIDKGSLEADNGRRATTIGCRERLGGLLRYYHRTAA
jgi:transposase InsO family protein